MDAKAAYETVASLAEALPEDRREEFAELMQELSSLLNGAGGEVGRGVRRWLKYSGWFRTSSRRPQ